MFHSDAVDGLFIPRARTQAVAFRGDGVEVAAGGASFFLALTPALLSSMAGGFARAPLQRGLDLCFTIALRGFQKLKDTNA